MAKEISGTLFVTQPDLAKFLTVIRVKKKKIVLSKINSRIKFPKKFHSVSCCFFFSSNKIKMTTTSFQEWDDLDLPEMDDPMMVAEYATEIFDYLKILEV